MHSKRTNKNEVDWENLSFWKVHHIFLYHKQFWYYFSFDLFRISNKKMWFPLLVGLGEPKIYHDSAVFSRIGYFTWSVVWLWRISGGYSQEMMGVQILCRFSKTNQKTNNPGGSSLALLIAPPVLQHRIRSLWLLRLSVPESCVPDRTRLILP